MIEKLAAFAKPVLILTGGEPMSRPDIYDLASCASSKGITTVMAPCGPLVTEATAAKMKASGIDAISISLDGVDAATHDAFRKVEGAFSTALRAIRLAVANGLRVQINCTVTKLNCAQLNSLHGLAVKEGAATLDFFFLVPTGRGAALKDIELDAATYEKSLNDIYELSLASPIAVKTTCAPQYSRIQRQRAGKGFAEIPQRMRARGCLGGKGFLFVSHCGIVQPCGFLKLNCGDLRKNDFEIASIYQKSKDLIKLRDTSGYSGACGACAFADSCGGCRARAYEAEGDFLASEPNCIFNEALQ